MNKGKRKKKQDKRPVNRLLQALLSPWSIGTLGAIAYGIYSIIIGQSAYWDLLNYHYYNGFAVFNGRLGQDILAAQLQTFINPLLDLPFYLGSILSRPITLGFAIGLVQGLNLALVYIIARRLLGYQASNSGDYVTCSLTSLMIAIVGTTAPLFLSEIGTIGGDNLTSIPVLAGIALVFCVPKPHKWHIPLLSGLLLGAATGLKLTNAVFAVGMIICAWWYDRKLKNSISQLGLFCLGCGTGFLLVHGWWSWYLWQEYGNPVFPYYNAVFQSPYYGLYNFQDARFPPDNIIDALSYPFQWAIGLHPSAEVLFRDLRFALISILIVPAAVIACLRYFRDRAMPIRHDSLSILTFFLVSYIIWISMFAIQRYMIVLELLTGLVIYLLLKMMIKSTKLRIIIFVPAALLMMITTIPADWGRTAWSSSWFDVRIPVELTESNQMFIMLTSEPYSYVISAFPPDSRFVRIDGNLDPTGTKFEEEIRAAIAEHKGPLYAISVGTFDERQIIRLAAYGLTRADTQITTMSTKIHPDINICRLRLMQTQKK